MQALELAPEDLKPGCFIAKITIQKFLQLSQQHCLFGVLSMVTTSFDNIIWFQFSKCTMGNCPF